MLGDGPLTMASGTMSLVSANSFTGGSSFDAGIVAATGSADAIRWNADVALPARLFGSFDRPMQIDLTIANRRGGQGSMALRAPYGTAVALDRA